MAKKAMTWKTKGMSRDLSVSAFNPEFSFENVNMRLSTNDGNTLMSWVNEKGTKLFEVYEEDSRGRLTGDVLELSGTPLGTAVINHYLILFTKGSQYDYIYRLKYADDDKEVFQGRILCKSVPEYMNLDVSHPIETLVSYESDAVQKVYWVDGINQPRVININKEYGTFYSGSHCAFDFVQELELGETITVQKQLGATGMFAPGVILYAFTYYNKNGQETCIFHTTPLQYISYKDRGASPEDKVENAFKIKITDVDTHFDYLRIYSIQRTSVNGTPICKRVQDIAINGISNRTASYTDTGTSGDTIDPTELLFKGGEEIIASTLEQKDNTLFLGNIETVRTRSLETLNGSVSKANVHITSSYRTIYPTTVSTDSYQYANQLTSYRDSDKKESVPCGGFKVDDYYRCGIQFQYKTGKWSDPIFIEDVQVDRVAANGHQLPYNGGSYIDIPTLKADIEAGVVNSFLHAGYKKARAVVVFPEMQDRLCICQGVVNPTLYTNNHRFAYNETYTEGTGDLQAQSSWFFRPHINQGYGYNPINSDGSVVPKSYGSLEYADKGISTDRPNQGDTAWNPKWIKQVEVQGCFNVNNQFKIDRYFLTFHSPEIEFDDRLSLMNFEGVKGSYVGDATFSKTLSDIDLQTETPAISSIGGGFVHRSFSESGAFGIVGGLFYDDRIIVDKEDFIGTVDDMLLSPYKWFVFPWHKTGSLNNDCNRPASLGIQTAKLKKKVISNLRYSSTAYRAGATSLGFNGTPELFSSDEVSIIKLGGDIYQGNIDTSLIPDYADGVYCAFADEQNFQAEDIKTPFNFNTLNGFFKTYSRKADQSSDEGLYSWVTVLNMTNGGYWKGRLGQIGDEYIDIAMKREPVRMRYKSTPHLVMKTGVMEVGTYNVNNSLPIIEVRRDISNNEKRTAYLNGIFGGRTKDAFRENTWIPCGEAKTLREGQNVEVNYDYGDTYYQRWDCLKTYPFTNKDINQMVEIGSFMLETRINIDGRYDRNRGQINNLNMTPQNFNLFNPVYNQTDNFFSYKIVDTDQFVNTKYPNQITWSKTKENGADIDLWTNVTLASVLELDGDKGGITSLQRLNDKLLCFQDSGISQILYNESVQISSTDGVPIEIANSQKVQGKRYISNTIGCSNKWSIVQTSAGIYFMDSNDKSIYRLGEGIQNISQQGGFSSWCKQHIPSSDKKWTPVDFNGSFVSFYDKMNQDVLFVNNKTALAYSEKTGTFTSFYHYGNTPFFCSLNDTGIWVRNPYTVETGGQEEEHSIALWKHQAGNYCQFFGENKPYSMILVGNPEPQMDKIFTNIEFRACVLKEGISIDTAYNALFDDSFDYTFNGIPKKMFVPYLPFNFLETWNEYQHGIAELSYKRGSDSMKHFMVDNTAHLARKFRMWRCDIPRDNTPKTAEQEEDGNYILDRQLGISRYYRRPMDRMRNPWLYLQLRKDAASEGSYLPKAEVHDVVMWYYI